MDIKNNTSITIIEIGVYSKMGPLGTQWVCKALNSVCLISAECAFLLFLSLFLMNRIFNLLYEEGSTVPTMKSSSSICRNK